ncbi:MAG: hypothetical protein IT334_03060 [Thermomicrobiales bacterium]|nr:hypothetical protein [Thermomicrobiales bacterium]
MPTNDAGNAAERLDALWDRLIAGEAESTHPSDGADAAFIATLMNQTPRLREPARHRIRHRVFASTEGATAAMSAPGLSYPNDGDLIAPIPNSSRPVIRRRFFDQPLLRVAAMLLLAVSLVGGWAIFRDDGDGPLRGVTYFPAGHLSDNDSTPQASEVVPQPEGFAFANDTIELGEEGPAYLGLFHVIIDPGASWQAPDGRGGITWIQFGEVTIANESTGETGNLLTGDITTSERNAPTITNTGSDPAHVIHGVVTETELASNAPGVTVGVSVTQIGSATAAPAGNRVATLAISSVSGGGMALEIVRDEVRVVSVITGVITVSLLSGSIDVYPGEVSLATPGVRDAINDRVQLFPLDAFVTTSGASYRLQSSNDGDGVMATFGLTAGDSDASAQASPVSVPAGEGVLIPVTPADCTIEPRSIDSFADILANPMANGTPQTNLQSESPAGVPADAETIAGVTDTIVQVVACNSPPTLEMYSIYSENLLRMQAVYGMRITEIEGLERFSPPENPDQITGYVTIQNVQILPDGRVTAMVNADNEIAFVTFVFENGRWLIDFWDDSFED